MQNSEKTITSRRDLRETLIREVTPAGLRLLFEQAVPVYLASDEYAGLPFTDRLSIMNSLTGLWDIVFPGEERHLNF